MDADRRHGDFRPDSRSELWEWADHYRSHAFRPIALDLGREALRQVERVRDQLNSFEFAPPAAEAAAVLRGIVGGWDFDDPSRSISLAGQLAVALLTLEVLRPSSEGGDDELLEFVETIAAARWPYTFTGIIDLARVMAVEAANERDSDLGGGFDDVVAAALEAIYALLALAYRPPANAERPQLLGRRDALDEVTTPRALSGAEDVLRAAQQAIDTPGVALSREDEAGITALIDGLGVAIRHPAPDPILLERHVVLLAAAIANVIRPGADSQQQRVAALVDRAADLGGADEAHDVELAQEFLDATTDLAETALADSGAQGEPEASARDHLATAGDVSGVISFVDTYLLSTGLIGRAARGVRWVLLAIMKFILSG